MKASLTDTLCTRCGLCCDGSLFADVELAGRAEATRMEIMGLDIDHDAHGELMQLPCAALQGKRCGIYAHRPQCCRTFECRLLQETRRGAVDVRRAGELIAETLGQIARVKQLLVELGECDERLPLKERCAEVLATEVPASPHVIQKQAEMKVAMAALESTIRTTFLGRLRSGRKS